ncbi:MAG: carboxypeptidase regulatory-like domain-containing protein [Candidatus Doudnabacteria bacterium]|nr:carboxypeptidase regulatory-like domain-containing protein [Candidatus Doudnabacteria bacterium]
MNTNMLYVRFEKVVYWFLIVAIAIWAFGPAALLPFAQAIVTTTITDLTPQFGGQRLKASSNPTAVLKVQFGSDSNGETLTSIKVTFASVTGCTGCWTSGAATSSELADLAAAADGAGGIQLWKDAGAAGFQGTGVDTQVALTATPQYASATTFILNPAVDPTLTTDDIYFVVLKTKSAPTNNNAFTIGVAADGDIVTSANNPIITPVTSRTITVDTAAPTLTAAMSNPLTAATGVPISTTPHMTFSEGVDQTTLIPANITLTAGSAVNGAIRAFPDGFDFIVSSAPTYTASTSFTKLSIVSTAFFQIAGTNPISPQGTYTAPVVGDIVMTQRETFPAELGLVTDATLTSGTFAVNGFAGFAPMQITKIATPAATGAVSASTTVNVGDIIVVNTTANPTDSRYNWHMVTTGVSAAALNGGALRLDGNGSAPTFAASSSFSTIAPAGTATDNGATNGGKLAVVVGDLVFVKIGAGSYSWHQVTTAGDLSSDATENTAFIDDGAADPGIAASSQMSKIATAANGAVTDTATVFAYGDLVFAQTTANAANNNAYNFHIVTNGATGANSTSLRFDNAPGSLATSTAHTLTMTTGIKDLAGNALATNQVITFTTGGTGGTNTTPPFVQSSQPQSGSQTHAIGAPIRLTFSVDMAASGGGSILADANIGLFTDVNGAPGVAVTTTKAYDSASRTVTLTPATLTAATGYVARVNTTATSTTGTALNSPSTQPYFLFFKTASGAADTAAPTVQGVSPATGSTGVSMSTVISAGFSEDIDPSTVSTTTVTLAKTTPLTAITGNVSYNSASRSVNFTPSTVLEATTGYTFTIVGGASGINDLSGNDLAANFTSTFTTTGTADNVLPKVSFAAADDFGVAITFNETMKTGGGPNAADNIVNYSLQSPTGSSISLGGKTVTYDSATKTARISGLSLQNGNTFKVTVNAPTQDLAGNGMDTTGTPANNTAFGTVQNSTTTGGNLGPGSGTINFSQQGMNPTRVTPMNRAAGATSNYKAEFLAATSVPSGGKIVLTFPAGFTVTNAAAVAAASSFCNADLNGPGIGAVTIAGSLANDNAAGTITITTGGDATGANAFLCLELSGIVNSTVPNTAGYTVDIKTRDTAANNLAILETKTASPFFLGQTGSRTLTVNVFNDNGAGVGGVANDNIKNGSEAAIANAKVFLFSPSVGGQAGTTDVNGQTTFTSLADGEYMIGLEPASVGGGGFALNSAPQPFTLSASSLTKNFGLRAAPYTISGTVAGPNGTIVDVFASSPNGFTKTTITLLGLGTPVAYSLPAQDLTTYNVGVGPTMPEASLRPGAPPPPPPTATDKTIAGTVVDSSGGGISNAGVFCRPSESSTGTSSGFGTGGMTNTSGAFTLNVTTGVYLCGVFKPGMPPAPEKQITVGAAANTPTSLAFIIDVATTLTISGTIKDDSGNAIPYAGVSGRKVVSTTNTTPVGGDSSNFAGGPTDANGAYTLYVTTGTWVVEAFAPGFGRLGTKTITVAASSLSGQDFSAQTLSIGTITGSATRDSSPVQGVMVRAESSSGGNMGVTDAAGAYTVKVPAGTYTITCFFPGVGESTPITGVVVTSGNTTAAGACALAAPITITVNVTDGTNPITNAGVEVRDPVTGRGNFSSTSTTSGVNAVYTVVVPPGTYNVRAGHPAYGSVGQTANVSTTQTITYNVGSSKQLYAVTGTVTGDAVALSGAWVSLNGTPTGATNTVFLGAQTIANGTFTINVPPGAYRIRADKPGYKSPAETAVTVTGAAVTAGTIALTTAARTIAGTVTLDSAGISNAFVDATDGNGGYAVAQTNASGAYTLNVDNGTWTIRAHSQGYEGGPLPVTVSGANVTGQTITLSAISGFTITAERPETVTPTAGGFIGNTDIGTHFQLEIPANALGTGSNAATVTTKVNTAMPNPPTGTILNKNAVTIDAVDASGQPISSLNDEITITIPYTQADLPAGTSEESLVIGVWNDATQTYDTLSTTVDTTLDTLTATVSHLSDFAPLVSSGGSPPATPTNLAASNTGDGASVRLTWTEVSGATSYNIYRSTDNSTFPLLANTAQTTGAYNATSLTNGTTYYFKISAQNSTGDESAATSAVTITVAASGGGGGGGGGGSAAPVSPTPTPTPTPTPIPTPTPTPSPSPTPTPAPSGAHSNGTLVNDNGTIYLIKSGKRIGFRNEAEYKSHGYNFGQAVAANAQDKTLPQAEFVQKALEGTLVLDAADNKTIYMIGSNGTKRGFTSESVFKGLGYNFKDIPKINLSDYPPGPPVADSALTHPDGALVLDGKTVWWIRGNTRQGFESEAVFNTYGFKFSNVTKVNPADKALVEGPLVKFRDGTLVKDGADYYLISDGKKLKFASTADLTAKGYKSSNAISGSLGSYESGGGVQ